jgi:WD40 repeat protein
VLIGDHGTQVNYFYKGTWTDGVAPAPLVSTSGTITSPYRGLSAFGMRDAGLFFGRESAGTDVLGLLSRRMDGPGLLVVSGVSGAGKSSLLHAGVLPRLRGAGLESAPEAGQWPCLVFTPARAPLEELAVRVAPLTGADPGAVWQGLAADPARFALTARVAALARSDGPATDSGALDTSAQRRLLIVVDQCEQLFTRCETERERRAFITALHAGATAGHGERQLPAAMVVLVIRADFEARLADYPQLTEAVKDRYLLTGMTELQLRMAITQPAVAAGSSVDGDLVQILLAEVRTRATSFAGGGLPGLATGAAGVLPLLSHALDQAWRARTGEVLTLADYERSGGIEGAVAESAESAYARLTAAQKDAARQVFTRLTTTSSHGTDTAARGTRSELIAGKNDAEVRDVDAVLEAFATERLLAMAADTVEISHEALLIAWPLLRDVWLAETRADRIVRNRLQETAAEWARSARDPSFLYRGSRLEAATDAAGRINTDARHTPLSQSENDFLHASRRAARRRVHRVQGFVAVLLALVVGLAATAVVAIRADQAALVANQATAQQRDIADAGLLASESLASDDATDSQRESLAAWTLDPSPSDHAAYYSMLAAAANPQIATLASGTGSINSVTVNSDGTMLAAVFNDGRNADDSSVQLWNAQTRQPIGTPFAGGNGGAVSAAFSPNGTMLAVLTDISSSGGGGGASIGSVRLWNTRTRQPIGTPFATGNGGAVWAAFSPNGTMLATLSSDLSVQLWNAHTRQPIGAPFATGNGGAVSATFSPDGTMLAVTTDATGSVQLWNAQTREPIGAPFAAGDGGAVSATFSPDGTILATVSDGSGSAGSVQLWNVRTRQPIGIPFDTSNGEVLSATFSPDGTMLATVSGGSVSAPSPVQLWNVQTRKPIGIPFDTSNGGAVSAAFLNDGTLVTDDGNGSVGLWNVAQAIGLPLPFGGSKDSYSYTAAAFSPNGALLATTGDFSSSHGSTSTVQLWNAHTLRPSGGPIVTGNGGAFAAALSPDGSMLATVSAGTFNGTDSGTVQLWSTHTHRPIGKAFAGGADWVAFSPSGTTLVTLSGAINVADTAQLWNTRTQKPIGGPWAGGDDGATIAAAFSPNGTMLATVGADTTVRLWNTRTRRLIGSPFSAGEARRVAFSPDGTTLAVINVDGTVQLWNASTQQPIGSPIAASISNVQSAAFSPDGRILATGSTDNTVRLWDVATGQQIGSPFLASLPSIDSVAFSPDGRTLVVVSDLNFANVLSQIELWNVGYLVDVVARLCAQVGGSLTPAEWTQYVGQGPPYRNICA